MTDSLHLDGISNERVLEAMRRVPRGEFVPPSQREHAAADRALPIGCEQTISQPLIVGLMTELASISVDDKVLEIGTGSGYQTAVLSLLASSVWTMEIVEHLASRARRDLERLGFSNNVHFRKGDGHAGWPEEAPFDAIVVTAAPREVPAKLAAQLKEGGRLVVPIGNEHQDLYVFRRRGGQLHSERVLPVRFVPMTGVAPAPPY